VTQIINRRENPSGKSLPNRQKFLERSKATIRKAVHKATKDGSVADILNGGDISISIDGIDEPTFHHGSGGIRDMVLPGNKKFVPGDILPRPPGGGGKGGKEAGTGDSLDQFRFTLTREEFLEFFLGDLELPDMEKRKLIQTESEGLRHAGFVSSDMSPISVKRTMLVAKARRVAQGRPTNADIEELMRQSEECKSDSPEELADEIVALQKKQKRIPFLDKRDIRRRHFEPQPKPSSQAVMFCLMDVSGSVSEHMKDLAKRFYMLLYVFLTRRYNHVDIIFIRHTDKAEEVDEKTFFYDPASGGTLVSSALELMHGIIKERYALSDWNIYAAQVSDGDNSTSDNDKTAKLLTGAILPISQFFAYLEVGEVGGGMYGSSADSNLWETYKKIKQEKVSFAMRKVSQRSDIYPVFRELFKKRENKAAS
jgi:uncharacterized protein